MTQEYNMTSGLRWKWLKLVLCAVLLVAFSGCGATVDPVKRKPVEIFPFAAQLPPNPEAVLFRFEDTIPGKPLPETVWDNVSGPFWDIQESKQIGFTQNYAKLVPVAAAAGVVGGAIGGALIGVTAGPSLVDTRIVIPFGRILDEVLRSGLTSTFPKATICTDDLCESQALQTNSPKYAVRIQVTSFKVWEAPLNHINLSATVVSKVRPAAQPGEPESIYEVRKELTSQSIGSVMSTSTGFISEMNKISNKFTDSVAAEIIGDIVKRVSM
jgi:hypothetical protein